MVNELRTSITQQVIRKDTGDKLQAFAISMFFKGKSNQSSRIQVNAIAPPSGGAFVISILLLLVSRTVHTAGPDQTHPHDP